MASMFASETCESVHADLLEDARSGRTKYETLLAKTRAMLFRRTS